MGDPTNADLARAAGLEVRRVALDGLHQDPANARSHGPENLAAIEASLRRFQQVEPLVVQARTGRVIGGNGRLAAMRALGWRECDVVELDVDDTAATALSIALNRTAETATWDEPVLARLLEELRAADALDGVGFSEADVDALLRELDESLEEERVVEDPGPGEPPDRPVSRRGDLWLLGDHRLLCGDSTDPGDVARLMAGEKAALMATDPPYGIHYTGADRPKEGKDWGGLSADPIDDLGEFLRAAFRALLPHLRDDAGIYVWHAHVKYPVVAEVFDEFDLLLHQAIVWVKPSSTFGYSYYRWGHEPCAFGWKRGHKPPHLLDGGVSTVWEVDWEGKARIAGEHPTQKAVRLFEIPAEMHTRRGEVVLEPFCGSGTQLIAAEKLARRCRAMEIEPAFVDVALRRWERATEKRAVLDGSGEPFDAISRERGQS